MTRTTITAGAAVLTLFLGFGTAHAESWSNSWTGPNGGTWSGETQCANGRCDRSTEYLGPNGAVRTKDSHCGYYGCQRSVRGTGPDGNSWSRSAGVVHGPFRSHGYKSFTGPEGNTIVKRRNWRRY